MASIKGIELKAIKYGNENKDYFFQASIYLNNKRAGIVTLLNNSKNLIYEWKDDESYNECLDISKQYIKENPIGVKFLSNIEVLINDLLELNEIEKEFKRVSKKGSTILALLKFNKRDTLDTDYNLEKEDMLLSFSKWTNSIEKKVIKNYNPLEIILYKDISEFDIN